MGVAGYDKIDVFVGVVERLRAVAHKQGESFVRRTADGFFDRGLQVSVRSWAAQDARIVGTAQVERCRADRDR